MKPKVSVIIPTLGRETLYPLVNNLLKQNVNFSYEIVLIPQVQLKENLLKDKKIKMFYEPLEKGFAYYRNVGIIKSKGNILVFIDDDELPINNKWLAIITDPIINNKKQVVTSGYKIKLGQGYWTDCISLLGFPGGGAVGFEMMWPLKNPLYTYHFCSGNFSIIKKLFKKIGDFDLNLKEGNEDVEFGDRLIKNNINILYLKEATICHIARKGYINFIKWNFLRGKSAAVYLKSKKNNGKVSNRLASSKRILTKTIKTKYFFGVLFMMFNQYFWQTGGYLWKKIKK